MKYAIYKVPNGKLLKIFLEAEDRKIQSVQITGDFFMYPEEKISELNNVLQGHELNEEKLKETIDAFFKDNEVELFGVDAESIATTILAAVQSNP